MRLNRKLLSGLIGVVLMGSCSLNNQLKYRKVNGVVKGGIYDNLFYEVIYQGDKTMLKLSGYGGVESNIPLRLQAYDKDNDGNFDSVTKENVPYNKEELLKIIENSKTK